MYRSTTPELIFNINNDDFDMSTIDICHVTLESDNGLYREIFKDPFIDVVNKSISLILTQEDTAKFNPGKVKIQLKMKLVNGSVICSKIMLRDMNEILEEEII